MGKSGVEDLLAGYGEIAALMRSHIVRAQEVVDGLQTPLGAIATWSPGLKSTFTILLNSRCPMFLVWQSGSTQSSSDERTLCLNDDYLSLLNERHALLQSDGATDRWANAWRMMQADVEQVLTTGQVWQRQQESFFADVPDTALDTGKEPFGTWSYSPIWDETGQVRGVFAIGCQLSQTQTERKQVEAALQESEARFQAFMSYSPTSAWIADQEGRLLYLSPTYAQMFQCPQQAAVGERIHDLYNEEFAQQFLKNNRRVFQTGQVIETVETAPRPDGTIGSFLVYKFPIAQASGEILLGGVAVDLTERLQTEKTLRQREEALRLITNALPVLIAYIDKDCYYRFNNQTYETWFGRSAANFTGQHVQTALGDAAYEAIRPHVEQALSGHRASFESQIPYREGGVRYIKADYVPHINSHGEVEGFFSLVSDISERKQADKALRQSEERLRLAQRAAGAGLWDWNIAANQVTWSDEYYRLYGLETTVTPSYENWLASILEVDRDRVDRAAQAALEHQTDLNVEFRVLHPTQGERWLTAIGQTFCNINGQPKRMTGIALDITKRKQVEKALERYQLLSQHSRDIVLYSREDGRILEANQAAVQAYGYDHAELLTLKMADLQIDETPTTLPEQLEQINQQGLLFETVHRRKDNTSFPVEVSAQSAVINNETVILSVVRDITERKQAELEREELLVREQAARKAAEVAEQQARFLAEASTTLTSSLDYEYTLSSVAQAVVPTLADWCAVDILKDDGTLERLAIAHVDPAKVQWGRELHRRYPPNLNAPQGLAQVLRTGQPEYYPTIADEQLVMAARDDEHLRILREVGMSSVMLVPLNARGKTLGTISFVSAESGRSYSLNDLSLAEELARRAAIALDNARLYRDAQQARQIAERAVDRITRLQTVTAALSETLTPEQVAEVIVEQSIAVLKAAAVLVVLVSQDRTELEIVKSIGYTEDLVASWRKFSINTDVPLANAVRTGEPVWVETMLERIARYPHLAEIYKRYEFNAWIALPLVVEGKSIGGLLLSFKEFKLLSQEDRDFILALTRQCAQAIVRAQLYAAEQWARTEAERANRIKDEFLAVLSHELRSPLNPILGWSKLLLQGNLDATRTTNALMTIERNAKLQAQLIDDLLDISRILRGKLTLNTMAVSLSSVITAAIDTVRLAIDAKAIQLHLSLAPEVGQVLGDAARLQQVVWNLLTNAAKFTPEGGQISVALTKVGTYAQLQVKDTGKGIHPEFLPYVFEHFRQEDGAITRKFGGLGLGLAIVRQIVELHGGTVQAESEGEGMGATFTVKLPLSKTALNDAPTAYSGTSTMSLKGVHILVVDDEADMQELATFVLEQQGADVITVASAQEALTALDHRIPDVLISDIGMPDMDGYTLMQQVRSRAAVNGGQILAIALTAYAGEFDRQKALAVGFQQHLAKPVEPTALINAIATLLNQSQRGE